MLRSGLSQRVGEIVGANKRGNEGFEKVERLSMERLMENDKVCCNTEEEVATTAADTSTATKRDDSHTDFRDTTSHFYT